jgi:hypothetical protein
MKKLIATAVLLLWVPMLALAQNADHQYRGQGYIFLGMGSGTDNPSFEHVGGGGEVLLFRGIGLGGELGAMGRPAEGEGVFSVGPSYHFLHASHKSKIDPFVQGGYTRTFAGDTPISGGSGILFNFGGGMNYWFLKRVGLRLEFRDYIHHRSFFPAGGETEQYWGVRIGLTVR